MNQSIEIVCSLIQKSFQAKQRLIYTMSSQVTTEDVIQGLREGTPDAYAWFMERMRIARTMLMRRSDPILPSGPPFGVAFLRLLAQEVKPVHLLFVDPQGVRWTAEDFLATLDTDPALVQAYSDALYQKLAELFSTSARTSPLLKASKSTAGQKSGWITASDQQAA